MVSGQHANPPHLPNQHPSFSPNQHTSHPFRLIPTDRQTGQLRRRRAHGAIQDGTDYLGQMDQGQRRTICARRAARAPVSLVAQRHCSPTSPNPLIHSPGTDLHLLLPSPIISLTDLIFRPAIPPNPFHPFPQQHARSAIALACLCCLAPPHPHHTQIGQQPDRPSIALACCCPPHPHTTLGCWVWLGGFPWVESRSGLCCVWVCWCWC